MDIDIMQDEISNWNKRKQSSTEIRKDEDGERLHLFKKKGRRIPTQQYRQNLRKYSKAKGDRSKSTKETRIMSLA